MRPCNATPTVSGQKGPVYGLDAGGRVVRLSRTELLSGRLDPDMPVLLGASRPPSPQEFSPSPDGRVVSAGEVAVGLSSRHATDQISRMNDRSVLARLAASGRAPVRLSAAQRLRQVEAEELCARFGAEPPQPLRVASGTSLFRSGQAVVRVAAPNRSAVGTRESVLLAGVFEAHGVPVSRPLPVGPYDTPEGDGVSVWEFIPNDPSAPFPAREVGSALRRLHSVPSREVADALGFELPPLGAALLRGRSRLERLASDSAGFDLDVAQLSERFQVAAEELAAAALVEDPVVLHGDVNPGNVLYGAGQMRLVDFEAATLGPWVWDLANMQIAEALGDAPAGSVAEMASGYGADPAASPSWGPLCLLRAINIVTFTVTEAAAGSPAGADAARLVGWAAAGFPGLPGR